MPAPATDGLHESVRAWLSRMPYLIDARFIGNLVAADDERVDQILQAHVKPLEQVYDTEGHAELVLTVVTSLLDQLQPLAARASFQVARLHALYASLLLAVGESPEDAYAALASAHQAVDIARRTEQRRGRLYTTFIAEQQLKAAVALKALDEKDESLRQLRKDHRELQRQGSAKAGVRLERQVALIHQEDILFRQLLSEVAAYRSTQKGEYYRTLKRVFEFRLNRRRVREAEAILSALLEAWLALPSNQKTVIEEVSFEKNLGQYFALTGQTQRAKVMLADALGLASRAGLSGQARQLIALLSALRDGRAPRLPSFQLRS